MRRYFSKSLIGICGVLLLLSSAGCFSSLYDDSENWAVVDNDTPVFFADYDLIFLYPTQEENPYGGHMNWMFGNIGEETRRYVRLVISAQFGPRVRVFSPFVPMLGFHAYGAILDEFKRERHHGFNFYRTELKQPIDYTVDALDVYFKRYNTDGHPFVVFGQGQGGLILYEAMKRCHRVKAKNGFVAGYFFGVPGVTPEEIVDEFGHRGIHPASRRKDVGIIAICNTMYEGEPIERTLAMDNGAVINPLNWCTDDTPAGKEMNPGSLFFDHKESNPSRKVKMIPNFCGAVVDPKHGVVVLTGIPKNCKFIMGEGHFGSDAWGIFAGSVSRDARERVIMYKFSRKGIQLPK